MNQNLLATVLGTIAQVAMVVAGHFSPAITDVFAIGGMGISALTGWGALRRRSASLGGAAGQGALAGAACALIGIGVSVALGDVPASLLAVGTAGSAVTGLIGGVIGLRR